MTDLAQARADYFKRLEDGALCPCCNRFGKIYRRKITSSMAFGLVMLNKRAPNFAWLHMNEVVAGLQHQANVRGNLPIMRYWDLLDQATGNKDDGNPDTGFYRLTPKGLAYLERRILVPKYMHVYNDTVIQSSGPETDIVQSLGSAFNYAELMGIPEQLPLV